jgi:hypothetical protein
MDTIPTEWLDKKIGVEEAEAAYPGISDERVTRFSELAKPFGGQSREWESLKAAIGHLPPRRMTGRIWPVAPALLWCGTVIRSWLL